MRPKKNSSFVMKNINQFNSLFKIMNILNTHPNKDDENIIPLLTGIKQTYEKEDIERYKANIEFKAKHLTLFHNKCNDTSRIHTKIYWLLTKPFTFANAYGNLSRNKGSMTPGISGGNISGFSWKDCEELAEKIKKQEFTPKPVKRIWIDKPGRKEKRPLGIPTIQDRVVQEALRGILESIYEPVFKETDKNSNLKCNNFGFRPELGCWDAIDRIKIYGQGINQVIEGDIKGAYDNVNQQNLISTLQKRIKDKKLLNLIKKFLRAGIMDMGEYRHSLLGVPQGGILSPLLFNIYMLEFDQYISNKFKQWETDDENLPKNANKSNEYQRTLYKNRTLMKKIKETTNPETKKMLMRDFKEHQLVLFNTPSYDQNTMRRKFIYVRYADDWILGFRGTNLEALQLKESIGNYLKEHLKLTLSDEKTKITNIQKESILFLGYDIRIQSDYHRTKKRVLRTKTNRGWSVTMRRTTSGKYHVIPDKNRILNKLKIKGFCKGTTSDPVGIRAWANLNEYQIVQKYRSLLIGMIQHYKYCDTKKMMNRVHYILRYSCAKTIATRKKITMAQTFKQYGKNLTIKINVKKEKEKDPITRTISFPTISEAYMTNTKDRKNDERSWDPFKIITFWRTKFKLLGYCAICGNTENIQMHHTNSIRKIGEKVSGFNRILQQINRKQIPVCTKCHNKITHGKYNAIKPGSFYDDDLAKF